MWGTRCGSALSSSGTERAGPRVLWSTLRMTQRSGRTDLGICCPCLVSHVAASKYLAHSSHSHLTAQSGGFRGAFQLGQASRAPWVSVPTATQSLRPGTAQWAPERARVGGLESTSPFSPSLAMGPWARLSLPSSGLTFLKSTLRGAPDQLASRVGAIIYSIMNNE